MPLLRPRPLAVESGGANAKHGCSSRPSFLASVENVPFSVPARMSLLSASVLSGGAIPHFLHSPDAAAFFQPTQIFFGFVAADLHSAATNRRPRPSLRLPGQLIGVRVGLID